LPATDGAQEAGGSMEHPIVGLPRGLLFSIEAIAVAG
jgi:hypothetical protein